MAATKAGKSALDIQVTKHSSDKLIWVKKEKKNITFVNFEILY